MDTTDLSEGGECEVGSSDGNRSYSGMPTVGARISFKIPYARLGRESQTLMNIFQETIRNVNQNSPHLVVHAPPTPFLSITALEQSGVLYL